MANVWETQWPTLGVAIAEVGGHNGQLWEVSMADFDLFHLLKWHRAFHQL